MGVPRVDVQPTDRRCSVDREAGQWWRSCSAWGSLHMPGSPFATRVTFLWTFKWIFHATTIWKSTTELVTSFVRRNRRTVWIELQLSAAVHLTTATPRSTACRFGCRETLVLGKSLVVVAHTTVWTSRSTPGGPSAPRDAGTLNDRKVLVARPLFSAVLNGFTKCLSSWPPFSLELHHFGSVLEVTTLNPAQLLGSRHRIAWPGVARSAYSKPLLLSKNETFC